MGRMTAEELAEKYRRKQEELATKGGDRDWDKLWATIEDGANYARFFADPESGELYLEGGAHWGLELLGAKDENGNVVKNKLCPHMFDRSLRCPICDLVNGFKGSKDPKESKIYTRCRAKERYFAWVAMLDSRDQAEPGEKGVQVLAFGSQILNQLLGYWTDPDYGDFTDGKSGRTAIITRTGEGLDTEYDVKLRPKSSAFSIPGDIEPIAEVIKPLEYNELLKVLGMEAESEEEEEEPKPPKRTPPKAAPKPKPKAEPEPEPDVEDEDEDEDGGEEPPEPESPPRRAQPSAKATKSGPAPPAKTATKSEKPECFGLEFMPRTDKCKACPVKAECKDVFLEST